MSSDNEKVVYKDDLRWIGAILVTSASILVSLSAFSLVAQENRLYPALGGLFLFFAATAFLKNRRVVIDPRKSLLTETSSDWRVWNSSLRKVTFSQCQVIVIGGSVKPKRNQDRPYRRVWLEVSGEEPILLTTIAPGSLPVAREAANRAASALGLEVEETRRKFPGD